MILVAAQTIATALACYGLWRLLRVIGGYGRVPGLIVGFGFAARAFLSQALFWISYLRLPLGRSLQLGPGFWFFGVDAEYYFQFAADLSRHPQAILKVTDAYPSPFFIQAFALAVTLFGAVPSAGILLNCAAYTGICFLIARLGLRNGRIVPPAIFALAAFSFSPAGMLWSMQPLKDTFFLLIVMMAITCCFQWHDVWTSKREARRLILPLIACGLGIIATVYALSAMRWYFGVVLWISFVVLAIGTTFTTRRRVAAALANVLLLLLLPKFVLLGARTDVPPSIAAVIARPAAIVTLPGKAARQLKSTRDGFDLTPGATAISAGNALTTSEPGEAPSTVSAVPTTTVAELRKEEVVEPEPQEQPPPPVQTTTVASTAAQPEPVNASAATEPPPQTMTAMPEAQKPAAKTPAAKPPPARVVAAAPPTVPPPARVVAAAPPMVPPPARVVAAAPPTVPPPAPAMPQVSGSTRERFLSGSAATILPRAVAQKIGLIRVGGGRGFWLFADFDTIVFDIVLGFALVYCTRTALRRRGRLNASFLQVAVIFVMIAVAIVYTVSNFGTLFRHRQMIYLTLCLLPVAMVRDETAEEPSQPAES